MIHVYFVLKFLMKTWCQL